METICNKKKKANSSERSECITNIVQKPKTENKIFSFCK